jgi:plasmid maintenance system antidote protein VapI
MSEVEGTRQVVEGLAHAREACNGLHIEEFATRMGVEREEVAALLEQIHALITRMKRM